MNICRKFVVAAILLALFPFASPVNAQNWPKDPLNSVMWDRMAKQLMTHDQGPIVFDRQIRILAPVSAEDQMAIPVTVDASSLTNVKKIVVLADLNPINHVLTYEPQRSKPFISFRFKAEQGTPIRAAALTSDGVWHMSAVYIDAAGGGCTAPAVAHSVEDWTSRLAEVRARIWSNHGADENRLRLRIQHPMDTGLADGIPALFVEQIQITSARGEALGRLTIREPVSENPVFTLKTSPQSAGSGPIRVEGRDNHGNAIDVKIPVPMTSSGLEQPVSSARL